MSAAALSQFVDLNAAALHLRAQLESKKFALLYAHNGTGKTRLSATFKSLGKKVDIDGETKERDTLYFNAFTEDLFTWHNDLDADTERYLMLHPTSTFFAGLEGLEMDNRIRPLLRSYADFDFKLDKIPLTKSDGEVIGEQFVVRFFRNQGSDSENMAAENIKISRGEENIFIWCFFLAIIQIVIDDDEDNPYEWVKYIYIDDPISSLDENNAIKVAHDLIHLLSASGENLRIVISTHHVLFYNVIANQLRKKASAKFYLSKGGEPESYLLENWENVPPFHHLSTLVDLCKTRDNGELKNHHFNMLRRVLEQTAAFFGYGSWVECLRPKEGESEKAFQKRILDLSSHGDWVIFESPKIDESMHSAFRTIFEELRCSFPFSPEWFPPSPVAAPAHVPKT